MSSYKTFFIFLSFFLFLSPSITHATSCKTESGQDGIISSTTGKCIAVLDINSATTTNTATTTGAATATTGAGTAAGAATTTNAASTTATNTATTTKSTGGLVPCGHGSDAANACTLCDLIIGFKNLIDFGSKLLITVTVVGIFVSGVMYIISAGNEQMITKAKSFLSASLVGFTIVLTAWLLVNVTMWALSYDTSVGIGKTNWYTFDCSSTGS